MPENAIFVGRPSRWGNMWPIEKVRYDVTRAWDWSGSTSVELWQALYRDLEERPSCFQCGAEPIARRVAVELFELVCQAFALRAPGAYEEWLAPLRGHDLACWCPLDQRCHGDVLLRLANP